MTKRYEGALGERKREYDALYMKKATILKSYNEKVKALKLKGLEIQDLIAKAKADGSADKGLLEILNKWEEANLKIFDKQGEDEGDDATELSLLEVAHNEINRAKENQAQQQQNEVDKKKGVKKQKGQEEEEMRRYMEELKKKEEELQ